VVSNRLMRFLPQNLYYSARSLRRSPGFTVAALLTLALGIGANTAVFSVVDAVILRPFPYRDPSRLVMIWDRLSKLGLDQFPPSFANYYDYRQQNRVFQDIAAFYYADLNLEGRGDSAPERIEAMAVSSNLFSVVGVAPALGQAFTENQNQPGSQDSVILSNGLWRRRFGADPGVVGQSVRMNGQTYRIQGVMPHGFEFTIRAGSTPDVYTPMLLPRSPARQEGLLRLIARLKPGVSLPQAQANMTAIAAGIEAAYHPYNGPHGEQAGYGISILPLRYQLFGSFRTGVLMLAGAVIFVLLIVCANVSNLLLARGARRQREIAVRAALGATRGQLVAELGAESLLLALTGGALGTLLAWMGIGILPALSPLPDQTRIALDARVLAFSLASSLLTGLIFSLAPVLRGARTAFHLEAGRTVLGATRSRFQSALVAAEVALSVALLAGAGLLLKSLTRLQHVDPGFDSQNVMTMRLTLISQRYRSPSSQWEFFDRLHERLRAIPGIESAALVNVLPLAGGGPGGDPFSIEGRPYDSSGRVPQFANLYRATPDYFRAMRIPLHNGRLLDDRDGPDSPRVVVINETMARGFWPNTNPIGRHVMMGAPRPGVPWLTIVGVVADVRGASLRWEPIPQIYTSFAQDPTRSSFVVLRTTQDPISVALAARRAISAADPEQTAFDLRTMSQRLSSSISRDRFQTLLLGIFAVAALALAAIGIYGVLEHSVSQRIPEIGLRMALGAARREILRTTLARGMAPVILGMALGLAAAFGLTKLLRAILFEVRPADPLTFTLVPILFLLVAITACFVPAHRATRVDPMTALRRE
jgi:putative ABC transport system permease protein